MTNQKTFKFICIGKRLLRILLGLLCTIILLVAVLAGIQCIATSCEKEQNPALGEMVDVNGTKMHVYTEGQGETTYVILSGGGIGAPVLEYKPLWTRFAEHGRIAVVEYMGYGWSEDTDAPRTSKNIVEEIRAALKGADINPPYVLVAHSIGGIYAMAYAQLHEDELDAIIALDTTLPRGIIKAQEDGQTAQDSLPQFGTISLLRKAGILRAMLWLNPLMVSGAPQGVYNEEEVRKIAMVTGWDYPSHTLINEMKTLERNMSDLTDFEFPKTLPVLMIQASPPGEESETHEWFLSERKRLTENLDHGKVVELPAGHSSIYWCLSDDIVRETREFLKQAVIN